MLFLSKRFEHFVCVLLDIHLIKDFGDLSIFVYQKSLSSCSHVLLAVHAFLAPDAVRLNDLFISVRDQIELKAVF